MGKFCREGKDENLIYAVKERYHFYRRPSECGGKLAIIQMRKHGIEAKNLCSRTFAFATKNIQVRINVEYVSLQ